MYIEGKYLLVSYRDIPHTDFVCENGGDLRVKVTKILKSDEKFNAQCFLSDAADRCVFIFENISSKIINEQEELLRVIHWYKNKFGLKNTDSSFVL
ncbi:hypothetical protein WG906_15135 [Pedobacter sp. P351]|uniref:hypothetical protein n=1 Tax=Pedobacter superstes TaxID=3133441 RepID=UPI0030A6A485